MYYIYYYIDPRDNLPFYVGKGINDRLFDHLYETEFNTENRHKFYRIQYLKNNGLAPIIKKVIENIEDEFLAYELETKEILKYGRIGYESYGILTNVCLGSKPPSPKGRIKSQIHRQRLSESHTGKIVSESTKRKNSDITKERIARGEFGHNTPHTEYSKIKTSITKRSQELKWYNNGEKSILTGKDAIIPEGYIKGRLVGKRGKYNKGKHDKK
jgi:hypothetical protein